jgi:hypothetical protein
MILECGNVTQAAVARIPKRTMALEIAHNDSILDTIRQSVAIMSYQ